MNNKRTAGDIIIADLKLYYCAIVTNTALQGHKNKHVEQCNKTEDPEINTQTYGHMVFDKAAINTHWERAELSTKGAGKIGRLHVEEFSMDSSMEICIVHTALNSFQRPQHRTRCTEHDRREGS